MRKARQKAAKVPSATKWKINPETYKKRCAKPVKKQPNDLQKSAGLSVRGLSWRVWGTPKTRFGEEPAPEPIPPISGAPFLAIFGKNRPPQGTPQIYKIAEQVFLRWPETVPKAEKSKK